MLIDPPLQRGFSSEIGDAPFNLTCVLPTGEKDAWSVSIHGTDGGFCGKKQDILGSDVLVHQSESHCLQNRGCELVAEVDAKVQRRLGPAVPEIASETVRVTALKRAGKNKLKRTLCAIEFVREAD